MSGDLTGVALDAPTDGTMAIVLGDRRAGRRCPDGAVESVVDATGAEVPADQPVGEAPVLVTGSLAAWRDLADRLVDGS